MNKPETSSADEFALELFTPLRWQHPDEWTQCDKLNARVIERIQIEAHSSADWLEVTEDNPKLGDIVWLWDGKNIWVGGREMIDNEDWLWGNSYCSMWHNGQEWDADLETDDDYKPTHWLPLPSPPNEKGQP